MRFARTGLLLLATLLLATPVASSRPAGSAPTPAGGRIALRGVNFIDAAHSAKVPVRIPQRAGVTFELLARNRDLRAEGPGRFAGIVLTKDPAFLRDTLIGGIVRKCGEPGCTGRATHVTHPVDIGSGRMVYLSPGAYTLYVIADGGPVEVRLLLHGLQGTRRITATADADAAIDVLPARAGGAAPIPAQISGAALELERRALVFDALWFEGRPSGVTDIGTCLYEGSVDTDPALAYSTLCGELGAKERGTTRITPTGLGFEELLLVFDVPLRAGTWSAGAHLSCTCALSDSGTWRLVLQQ